MISPRIQDVAFPTSPVFLQFNSGSVKSYQETVVIDVPGSQVKCAVLIQISKKLHDDLQLHEGPLQREVRAQCLE